MKFADIPKAAPLVVLDLQPSAFATRWEQRPKESVQVGLRLPSEADEAYARMTAEQAVKAIDVTPATDVVAEHNTMVMTALLARALCRADDASKPWELFPAPDEHLLMDALTSATIRYLFEQLELAKIQYSQATPEATDDEIERVSLALDSEALDDLPRPEQLLARRLCAALFDLIY